MPRYDFTCKEGHTFEHDCKMVEVDDAIACTTEGCAAPAMVAVTTYGGIDHGIGCFSDAAKEGRFDEDNLSTRYMSSGRAAGRKQR